MKLASSMTFPQSGTTTTIGDNNSNYPGIFHSTDYGATWSKCTTDNIPTTYIPEKISSGVGPNTDSNARELWVVAGWDDSGTYGKVRLFYSHDGIEFYSGKKAKVSSEDVSDDGNHRYSPQITGLAIGYGDDGKGKVVVIDPGCTRIYFSVDYGMHWYSVDLHSNSSLHITNSNSGIFGDIAISTDEGFLVTSDDDGQDTYSKKILYIPYRYKSFYIANSHHFMLSQN